MSSMETSIYIAASFNIVCFWIGKIIRIIGKYLLIPYEMISWMLLFRWLVQASQDKSPSLKISLTLLSVSSWQPHFISIPCFFHFSPPIWLHGLKDTKHCSLLPLPDERETHGHNIHSSKNYTQHELRQFSAFLASILTFRFCCLKCGSRTNLDWKYAITPRSVHSVAERPWVILLHKTMDKIWLMFSWNDTNGSCVATGNAPIRTLWVRSTIPVTLLQYTYILALAIVNLYFTASYCSALSHICCIWNKFTVKMGNECAYIRWHKTIIQRPISLTIGINLKSSWFYGHIEISLPRK